MPQNTQPTTSRFRGFARLKKVAEQSPLFLITLPLFVIIHIENRYHHFIVYSFVYREILWLFLAPVFTFLISWLLFRHMRKAMAFSLLFLLFFYFFADLKDGLQAIGGSFLSKYVFLLPFVFGLLVAGFILIKKSKSPFKRLFLYVNLTLLLFIISDVIGMLINASVRRNDLGDNAKTLLSSYQPCDTCAKPDIFYIVFDEYSSSEILLQEFNYQNDLDSFLVEKKFRVVPHSRSNYNLTPFSIGSCFNLNYLNGLNVDKDFYMKDYLPGLPTVYKSELVPILEKQGYQFINHSIFTIEDHKPRTKPFDLWKLSALYGRHNMFKKIDYEIGWMIRSKLSLNYGESGYREKRNNHVQHTYEKLLQTIEHPASQPEFVYAHFMLPHAPYCFDPAGKEKPAPALPLTKAEDKKAYIDQLIYTNSLIRELTGKILSSRKRPFVLILQGDHGYKQHDRSKNHLEFGNLNAMYFYNQDYQLVHDNTSNVNTFRIVLNTFFNKKYEMLKDTTYFLQYR